MASFSIRKPIKAEALSRESVGSTELAGSLKPKANLQGAHVWVARAIRAWLPGASCCSALPSAWQPLASRLG
jgi:hypothetical protein